MITTQYNTDKLNDIDYSKEIAKKVRSIFDDENLIDTVLKYLDGDDNSSLKTDIYNFHGATVIVKEWDFIEFKSDNKDKKFIKYPLGVVICKWGCNNELVNNYIMTQLDNIEGMIKNNPTYNLPT